MLLRFTSVFQHANSTGKCKFIERFWKIAQQVSQTRVFSWSSVYFLFDVLVIVIIERKFIDIIMDFEHPT